MNKYGNYIAHLKVADEREQLLPLHLCNVKNLAEIHGRKLKCTHIAGLCGMLHDVGKYSEKFQKYIRGLDKSLVRGSVTHAATGGQLIYEIFKTMSFDNPYDNMYAKSLCEIVANVIFSHHSGLKDMLDIDGTSDFDRLLNKEYDYINNREVLQLFYQEVINENDFKAYFKEALNEYREFIEITMTEQVNGNESRVSVYLPQLTKMLRSILIDSDWTDARLFDENKKFNEKLLHINQELFINYQEKLENHLKSLDYQDKTHMKPKQIEINRLRKKMSDKCKEFGSRDTGVYRLPIPTGGGKTLSSLRFAIEHAIKTGKDRIVYVIPYTTILEQNVSEVSTILKDEKNILEHHSAVVDEIEYHGDWEEYNRSKLELQLSKETWDKPIIFTTMVRFLETFMKNDGKNNRKIHNLSNSVLIFDEIQSIPINSIHIFNETINFLRLHGNTTTVLCTATQPELTSVEKGIRYDDGEIVHLTNEELSVFNRTKLINMVTDLGWDNSELVNDIVQRYKSSSTNSTLIILNTKKDAVEVFEKLRSQLLREQELKIYYLTTNMCATHRLDVINDMRKRLSLHKKVICISTSLIEAGVNISFPIVYRALIGLDSIAQSAGRCNRHGELEEGVVVLFKHRAENLMLLESMRLAKEKSLILLKFLEHDNNRNINDLLNAESISTYFKKYYYQNKWKMYYPILNNNSTTQSIYSLLFEYRKERPREYAYFHTSAYDLVDKFYKVIDQDTVSVLVPYKEGKNIIREIREKVHKNEKVYYLLKKGQRYTVNVYRNKLQTYIDGKYIEKIQLDENTYIYSLDENKYDTEMGIHIQ